MKSSSVASKPNSVVCPLCETGQLHPSAQNSMRCEACGQRSSEATLEDLRRIVATYLCPACGSEVLPIDASSAPTKPEEHGAAYWAGWVDGRFGEIGSFVDNPTLMKWEYPYDRLAYYQGHRVGSEARWAKGGRASKASKELTAFPLGGAS